VNTFTFPVRVYWEDTDAGRVVYFGSGVPHRTVVTFSLTVIVPIRPLLLPVGVSRPRPSFRVLTLLAKLLLMSDEQRIAYELEKAQQAKVETVRVDAPLPAGIETITNTVVIADDGLNGADTNPGNNGDSDGEPSGPAVGARQRRRFS